MVPLSGIAELQSEKTDGQTDRQTDEKQKITEVRSRLAGQADYRWKEKIVAEWQRQRIKNRR